MPHGTVTSVESRPLGSELVSDAAAGITSLAVDMVVDFDEDGGLLLLNGYLLGYDSVDPDAETIALTVPLAHAATADDFVAAFDAGKAGVEWFANVAIDDGDTIPAVIPTTLIPFFPEGTYDDEVTVEIALVDDEYQVTSQPQRDPSFDGADVWNPFAFRDFGAATIPDSTYTIITSWATGEFDGIDVASGYTITNPGVYFVSVQVGFFANPNGARRVRIFKNGVQIAFMALAGDSATSTYLNTSTELRLAEQDVITTDVWQNSGAGLALVTGFGASNFKMHRVSV